SPRPFARWRSPQSSYSIFHLRGASPSALRLDASEKRSSRVFVLVNSAWVPVTHASVTPFRRVLQTAAVAALAVVYGLLPVCQVSAVSLSHKSVAVVYPAC